MAKLTAKQVREIKARHAIKMIKSGHVDFEGHWHVCVDVAGRSALADELLAKGRGGLAFEVEAGNVRRVLDLAPELRDRVVAHYKQVCAVV